MLSAKRLATLTRSASDGRSDVDLRFSLRLRFGLVFERKRYARKKGPLPKCRGDACLRARHCKGGDLDPRLCDSLPLRTKRSTTIHAAGNCLQAPNGQRIGSPNFLHQQHEHGRGPCLASSIIILAGFDKKATTETGRIVFALSERRCFREMLRNTPHSHGCGYRKGVCAANRQNNPLPFPAAVIKFRSGRRIPPERWVCWADFSSLLATLTRSGVSRIYGLKGDSK